MANIQPVEDNDSGLVARTKINEAIVEANKVDSSLVSANFLPQVSSYTASPGIFLDNNLGGRRYAASQNVTEIVINEEELVDGAMVEFAIDGSAVVTITTTLTKVTNGEQLEDAASTIFFRYSASLGQLQIAYFPAASKDVVIPLAAPTYSLAAGAALELDYTFDTEDQNADGAEFMIATQSDYSDEEVVTGFVYNVDGTIDKFDGSDLTDITYYTRLRSTSTNTDYSTSPYAEESAAAAALSTMDTPTLALVAGNTELDYTVSAQDAVADGGEMQISDDDVTYYTVTTGEYQWPDTTGTITDINGSPLVNSTLYYVLFRNTTTDIGYETNSAYASDTETPIASTIVFQDDFTNPATGVPNSSIWDLLNTNPSDVSITQAGGQAILASIGNNNTSPYDDMISSKTAYALASGYYLYVNLEMLNQNNDSGWTVGFGTTLADRIIMGNTATSGDVNFTVRENSVTILANTDCAIDLSTAKSIKIAVSPTDISLHLWNGSAYGTALATVAHTWASVAMEVCAYKRDNTGTLNDLYLNEVILSTADFSTEKPV